MRAREEDVAVRSVLRAMELCEAVRATLSAGDAVAKEDRSPVTVADFGAQALIVSALHAAFPEDPVMAEEETGMLAAPGADALRASVIRFVLHVDGDMDATAVLEAIAGGGAGGGRGRFWTLDPIDGTKGFVRGDQYAVALALVEEGRPVLGVLGCPALAAGAASPGWVFHARRGGGALCRPFRGGAPVQVRVGGQRDPAQAVFCESFEKGHTAQDRSSRIRARLGTAAPCVRMDSQCKYAVVARGGADVYMRLPTRPDYEEKLWDHAAGALIVEEAGGRVSDAAGHAIDFSQGRTLRRNRGVLATNRRLHEAVLAAIGEERDGLRV